jgi:glucosamine--fructose-6-phosphate aminotransferase (isomerizing)
MCGIVGGIAERNVTPILLEGLRRLEYRGYDSSGIALLNNEQALQRVRALGKINQLEHKIKQENSNFIGTVGIAHTRWATHGVPSEKNAHPHISKNQVAVVHNGIIENYQPLKTKLIEAGYEFTSDTDTEVVVHKIHQKRQKVESLLDAVRSAISEF